MQTKTKSIGRILYEKSRDRFQLFADNFPDIITITEPDGTICYANPTVKKILGYEPTEKIGKNIFKRIHPDDQERVRELFNEVLTEPYRLSKSELRYSHQDGSWRFFDAIVINFLEDPVIRGILVHARDTTDRIESEKNLRRAYDKLENLIQERTRELEKANKMLEHNLAEFEFAKETAEHEQAKAEAILTSIGEGLVVTDTKDQVILINRTAERLLGHRSEQVLGRSVAQTLRIQDEAGERPPKERRPLYWAGQGRSFSVSLSDNCYFTRADGSRFPVSVVASPVILNNKIRGKVVAFRDISREKEIERAKSEFISLASHQLRTPLSTVNWYVETILTGEDKGLIKDHQRDQKYLKRVWQANKRMIRLVNDLLNVSRLELGTFEINLSKVNFKKIVQNVLRELKPHIQEKNLRVEESYRPNLPKFKLDERIVRIIFENLISNAVKYTPEGGTVSVYIDQERRKTSNRKKFPNRVLIRVADNGCGIPKDQQKKTFTKFFRAENARGIDSDGTGLGLYIAKSLVGLLKGNIWFTSKLNRGTTFCVAIPLTEGAVK